MPVAMHSVEQMIQRVITANGSLIPRVVCLAPVHARNIQRPHVLSSMRLSRFELDVVTQNIKQVELIAAYLKKRVPLANTIACVVY